MQAAGGFLSFFFSMFSSPQSLFLESGKVNVCTFVQIFAFFYSESCIFLFALESRFLFI